MNLVPIPYKQNLAFQIKAPFLFNPPGNFVYKDFNVFGGGVPGVDNDVAVPGGYLGPAYIKTPQAQLVDDPAGGVAKVVVVLKSRTGRGIAVVPLVAAIPAVIGNFPPYVE